MVGREATQVDIPYTSGTVGWTYDPTKMVYGRSLVGVPQVDRLTNKQLIDAVAVGQFTPGPLFTTATFIGYVLGGWTGAAVATMGIFLPGFLLVAAD